MLEVSREEITGGSLSKALLVLAAPLFVQNLVQVLQQVVDIFWLGRLGGDAVAAVGLSFPVTSVLLAVVVGSAVGTQVLVSQRAGADDLVASRRAAVNGTVLGFVAGLLVGSVTAVLASRIVAPLAPDAAVAELAAVYLGVYALALPIFGATDSLESSFVGWGDSRAALYVNAVAVAINVILDPVLIFGWGPSPEFGVAGAALATGVGYAGGLLLGVVMFVRGRDGFVLERDVLTFEPDDVREIVDIGWPNAGQHLASQGVRVAMVAIVGAVGGAAGLAAYTVGARIASVAFIPAVGLQRAAQSVVGQNLGADRPDRARRATWLGVAIAAGGLAVVGGAQWLVPDVLADALFPDATPIEFEYTVAYLRILAYGYWAIGATYLLQAGFNGARRTRTSMIASLGQYWGVRLPVAAAAAYVLEASVTAVFWAVTVSNVAAAIGLAVYYWYETARGMNTRAATRAATAD